MSGHLINLGVDFTGFLILMWSLYSWEMHVELFPQSGGHIWSSHSLYKILFSILLRHCGKKQNTWSALRLRGKSLKLCVPKATRINDADISLASWMVWQITLFYSSHYRSNEENIKTNRTAITMICAISFWLYKQRGQLNHLWYYSICCQLY